MGRWQDAPPVMRLCKTIRTTYAQLLYTGTTGMPSSKTALQERELGSSEVFCETSSLNRELP